ncbi:hypothetical protein QO010_000227 [Caulobacter ginsengisoli]|uniref:Uncharacterized protein n=1 Tax=Caulobacter ginsengisoli TaxID=400775 RepID=A0ABU0IN98_9CAUL|nr:hypothetical protein [Caulobacter ginsengisoli]MDQ0462479.1 hypothetical protein [Caulobacter ginsengisoli]
MIGIGGRLGAYGSDASGDIGNGGRDASILVQDDVMAIAVAENVLVRAGSAKNRGGAAGALIVARPRLQDISPGAALEEVNTRTAIQPIRAGPTVETVIALVTAQVVAAASNGAEGDDRTCCVTAGEPDVGDTAGEDGVIAATAEKPIIQTTSDQRIISVPAQNIVSQISGSD